MQCTVNTKRDSLLLVSRKHNACVDNSRKIPAESEDEADEELNTTTKLPKDAYNTISCERKNAKNK